jgi:hypothetical protein
MRLRFDWPFSRRSRATEPDNEPFEDAPALTLLSHHGDKYSPTWERTSLPSPGVQTYAWETLGLMPFSTMAIGTGIEYGKPLRAITTPGFIQQQTLTVQGIPLQSGAFVSQPLLDPETGGFHAGLVAAGNNDPFHRNFAGGALDVNPY